MSTPMNLTDPNESSKQLTIDCSHSNRWLNYKWDSIDRKRTSTFERYIDVNKTIYRTRPWVTSTVCISNHFFQIILQRKLREYEIEKCKIKLLKIRSGGTNG